MEKLGFVDLMEPKGTYRHGGDPESELSRLGLTARPIIDFSVNLNPLGPPAIIRNHWSEVAEGIESYPTPRGEAVARYYQVKYGIPTDRFLPGNGSTEMIYLLPRALGLKKIVVAVPSYHDYTRASILAGAEVVLYRLGFSPASLWTKTEGIADLLKDAEAVWLGNPNNPTGTLLPKGLLVDLADRFPEKWIIIDEAFMDFVEGREEFTLTRSRSRPNILVIHSLTKFYALAGVRLGGVVGHPAVISRLQEGKEPWTVNGMAEKIAPLLLECDDYDEKTRVLIKTERIRLLQALGALKGITTYPSAANFILCQWHRTDDLDDLLRYLLSRGLYVRDCRNFAGLEGNYFRVAVRAPAENDQLLESIASISHASHD
jgi:threonine-phosphate decarboxylase